MIEDGGAGPRPCLNLPFRRAPRQKMTSIDGSDLRCNACWKSLLAQLPSRSYKT